MSVSRKIRWLGAALALAAAPSASGQTGWVVRAASPDTAVVWPERVPSPEAALEGFHRRGHLAARVDSSRADTLFATPGPRARVGTVEVAGTVAIPPGTLTGQWATREGAVFDADSLDRDLDEAAARYAARGYADAVLSPRLDVSASGARVDVTLNVAEGAASTVAGVELVGARSPARSFASRVAGVEVGTAVEAVDAEAVRRALDATALYAEVGEPVLARTASGELVLQVPVREAPPGSFDVVLGYLPPDDGVGGGVIGNGRVALRNLFGGGRAADIELVRNPGLASALDVAVRDPFAFGTPFGLGARFEGLSRDSTFSRQRYALDVSYPVAEGLSLIGSVSREAVRPGTFGADSFGGRPRVRRSDVLYLGVGIVVRRLDAPLNPRRGGALSLTVEQGRPRREASLVSAPEADGLVLRRLRAEARGYVPTFARQTLVVGLDAALVQGAAGGTVVYDEADLFRLGGAQSLRGYDEEAFVGRGVGRAFAEYRLLLDAESFAFAFSDLGVADRPPLPGVEAETRVLPGYGAGLRVRTGVGLASISYALNPDLPLGRGKVHVGLAVGL